MVVRGDFKDLHLRIGRHDSFAESRFTRFRLDPTLSRRIYPWGETRGSRSARESAHAGSVVAVRSAEISTFATLGP